MSLFEELSADWIHELLFSLRWYMECYLSEPDTVLVFGIYLEVFGDGTHLAMPKTIYAPDSSSLKPGSGATEGLLDKGLSEQPDYILLPDCWTMKIQD